MGWWNSIFSETLVGLDIGISGIKAVELSGKRNPRLIAYNRVPLPWDAISREGEIKRRDYVVQALKKMFALKNFTTKKVALGAFGNSIIAKKISVPKMTAQELEHQLYWEAEQYIPFDINEVNLDFAILGPSRGQTTTGNSTMDVLLVAAKKDYVQNLRSIIEEAGLEVTVIDNQSFALGNSFEFNYGYTATTPRDEMAVNVIIDCGAGSTKVSIVEGDKTTYIRELRQSGIGCSQLISEKLGVSLAEAEKLKITQPEDESVSPLIEDFVTSLSEEIARSLDYFMSQNSDLTVQTLYLCGGGARLKGLSEKLKTRISTQVEPLNPIRNISGSGKEMNSDAVKELKYLGAVAIGLSLRRPGDSG